ncbi:SDR family NAD(P)-dependent oxidoreductase [Streptomyces sp. GQFP]|uniref:SDR family NAD(P)-dependent oxidoreductase n=1 Tax=Streptomyces sp. GQFP TaxID=2907545 RepID=UPI001F294C78|nr:SDR family NAD(P)-dependent oxidoreductase [Streptomyces sp. GQFP]UIX32588.1 SDR family NAD(P)-dependent oxidoreductase [Streptomyces sp. GQFP]
MTAVTLKFVGYAETVRVLRDRLNPGASVVLFGGLARERPYPGLIADSPKWRDVLDPPHSDRAPIGRLVAMAEIADATDFLLRKTGLNAHDLYIDGGLPAT